MVCIDSNIFIYSTQPEQESLRKWFKGQKIAASVISKIEVLGYYHITKNEIQLTNYYFSLCQILDIDDGIVALAINLKQEKRMSLGDAIIAATALQYKLPLATANTKDFIHLIDLELIDPLQV